MEYKVGQIIYLLDVKRNAVLPARVYEQVTKRTIDGEEEFFFVEVPGASDLLNLSDFEGLVFDESEKVKNHLFETLKANIDSIVEKAAVESVERWGELKKAPLNKNKKKEVPEDQTIIDLGDGRVARFKD